MSTKVGDIFVRANLDDKQYQKGLTGLGKATSSMSSKLAKALTVTAVVTGVTKAIRSISVMGDTVDKMSQKLGMSNKVYQEWDYIMQRSGASIDSMTVAMKTLASSVETGKDALAELGITQQEAMSMSQEELFATVVKRLQGVEDVTHRTYLATQLLGRGSTELGAVLNLTQEDMANLQARVEALGGVMSDTAVKNSAKFRDSLTDIKMAFRGIANTLAEYVLPILTKAINNFIIPAIVAISNAIRSLFNTLGKVFAPIKKGLDAVTGKVAQKDYKNASSGISNVANSVGDTGKNAKSAKKQVQALKRELLGFDKITKLSGEQGTTTGNTGTSGGGISAGGIDFSQAEADTQTFAQKASELLNGIELPQPLKNALDDLKTSFSNLFETLKTAGKWAWDNVLKPLGEWTINDLVPTQIEALSSAFDLFNSALKFLGEIFEPIWTLLKPFFEFLGQIEVSKIQGLATAFDLLSKALNLATTLVQKFKSGWDSIKEKSKALTLSIVDKFSKKWKSIRDSWDAVKKKFKGGKQTFTLKLIDEFSKKWKSIKKVWDNLKSRVVDLKMTFTETFRNTWNSMAKAVNGGIDKSEFLKKLFQKRLPYLAQGGYVKANTPQLAVIGDNKHEGEIVSPESKFKAMAQEVAGAGNAETIRLLNAILTAIVTKDCATYLDGEQIKNNTVRRINNHTRATGQLELIV